MPLPIPGGGRPPAPGGGGGGSPPTPWIGAAPNPIGATPGAVVGIPRPVPRAIPGPPGVNLAAFVFLDGGGPSTAKLTTFSPRIKTNPSDRFSVRSSRTAPLLFN